MSKTPRPYQTQAIADLREAMRDHKRVVLVLPTGAGKTVTASTVAKGAAAKGKRVMFLVHRTELLEQTSRTFDEEGIPHGFIRAGAPTSDDPVTVASVQTLIRRLSSVRPPDLMFVDEAAHAVSPTWRRVFEAWPNAWAVGLTATPERLDGRGLGDVFGAMVIGPSTAELIQAGFLADYRAFAPSKPDLAGLRTAMGDYDQAELEARVSKPRLIGDIVQHYLKHCAGKRAIGFAASIRHSQALTDAFRAAGISAAHVDGDTPKTERAESVAAFARGDIQVLWNVDLFGEGFDVPGAEVAILARPTLSLALYLQQIGRVLRWLANKIAIIMDHAGNIDRHGLPDDPRSWSLDSAARKKRDSESLPTVKQCPMCFCCHRPAVKCPECGHEYVVEARQVEVQAGSLKEIAREKPEDWCEGIDLVAARGWYWFKLLRLAGDKPHRLKQIAQARGFRRGWVQHQLAAQAQPNPPSSESANLPLAGSPASDYSATKLGLGWQARCYRGRNRGS